MNIKNYRQNYMNKLIIYILIFFCIISINELLCVVDNLFDQFFTHKPSLFHFNGLVELLLVMLLEPLLFG